MKGPGLRVDLDVRRVWKCPRCGTQRPVEGDVTSVTCYCQPDGTFMQLQEPLRQVKKFPHPGPGYLSGKPDYECEVEQAAVPVDGSVADAQLGGPDAVPTP